MDMTEAEELLFRQCKDFVDEQSEGEWDDETIAKDARAMMAFIDKVRPRRVKLNMEATPDLVAMLDGSAKREDEARVVARIAATLVATGKTNGFADAVGDAREILAESRRQAAAPAGERDDG